MAKLLLDKGDDLEATAKEGSTPLVIATVKGKGPDGYREALEILHRHLSAPS